MSIHYDPKRKTYYVRWRVIDRSTGNVSHKKKSGFATKKEAKEYEAAQETEINALLFSDVLEDYLASLKGYASEETIHSKRRQISHYCSQFMNMDVNAISKKMVSDWKNDLSTKPIAIDTKNQILANFKAVGKYAYLYNDVENFAKILKRFPKSSSDVHEMNIISPEDFELILSFMDNEDYKRFFRFLYHTGVRRGEAIGLKKDAVDGRYVQIRESIRRRGKTSLKTPSSRRTILLDDVAYEIVQYYMDMEGDYVFGGYEPIAPQSISNNWNPALKKANKVKNIGHVRIHDLRHSFVSNAIMNGANIVTVSKYVGHKNTTMTLDIYSHLLTGSQEDMIKVLEGVYKK